MSKYLLAGVALLALSGAAYAADLTSEPAPAPMDPIVTNAAFDWTGFYVGVHGGGAVGGNFTKDLDGDANGGIFGAQLGYNYQIDHWVIGVETDLSYTSISDSGDSLHWLGSTTARAGYAFDNLLLYAKGGVAYGELKADGDSKWEPGWTAGLGAEYAFTKNITGRLEYDYVDLSSADFNNGLSGGVKTNEILAGLNYKF